MTMVGRLADAAGVNTAWLAKGEGDVFAVGSPPPVVDPAAAEFVADIANEVRAWADAEAPSVQGADVGERVAALQYRWRKQGGNVPTTQLPTPKGPVEASGASEPQTVPDASAIELARVAWLKKAPPKARAERETWSASHKLAAKGAVSEEQLIAMWDRAWLEHIGRALPDARTDKTGGVRERQARLDALRAEKGIGRPKG